VWDLRAMRRTAEVAGAHQMPVRDVDFAAGREHLLLSAGDDCRLRFWDLRRAPAPAPPPPCRALAAEALLGPAARPRPRAAHLKQGRFWDLRRVPAPGLAPCAAHWKQ